MSASSASTPSSSGLANVSIAWLFSSIGKKTVVALTGIVLVLFVIGHMIGNMTVFFGPDVINAYAMHLRDLGPLLWLIRLFMLTTVVLHIWFTMLVWKENMEAHPQKYAVFAPMKTTIFARTMRLTGLILLAFIVFHLAHFTLLLVDPGYANYHADLHGREVHDVYRMVIVGFRNPLVSLFYIVAMALLAFHLSHGIGSLFQTLGITDQKMRSYYETGAQILAWVLFIGYVSIPASVLFFGLGNGVVK
jgi:succinate dehydrogenase / fumarate reductase cytochrome b subunit